MKKYSTGDELTFGSDDVEVVSRENCYRGFFAIDRLVLRHRLFRGGWSAEFGRELFIQTPSAGILLYDPDLDKVILLEQFRVGTLVDGPSPDVCPWLLEIVAGLTEPDESAEALVLREAREEAGCEVRDVIPIGRYFNSPGGSAERISLFCGRVDASDAGGIYGLPEENEDIRVVVVPFEKAWQAVQDGRIANAMAIIAIQWLFINRENIRSRWSGA